MSSDRKKALRLTSGSEPPDPADGPFALERMTALSHELRNLLDGSLRCLSLAKRDLFRSEPEHLSDAVRRLETVQGALERMADLVTAAMRGSGSVVGSATLAPQTPITLSEAIAHAAEVLTPEAREHGIDIQVSLASDVTNLPAGPVYSVLVNAIKNAVESIQVVQKSHHAGGRIEVRASRRVTPTGQHIILEVIDDGRGLTQPGEGTRAFRPGFSTKPGGLGVGLALASEVVREMAGMIELLPRPERLTTARPGAILRVCWPIRA